MHKKIQELMNQMTIEEKIGQLNQVGTSIYGNRENLYESSIRKGKIGSFLSISGTEKINHLQKIAVEETRLGIPLIFAHDIIHGYKTIFPVPLAESCSWDKEVLERSAKISAIESWAAGINWTFSPMIDISRDPRWGRIMEGFGEDPYLSGIMAKAKIKGYQNKPLSEDTVIAACAKHFVAYGKAEGGRDYNKVDISYQQLFEIYMPPFIEAVKSGVETVMTAFNDLNGIPCTANKRLIKKILKEQFKFNGLIISDHGAISELITHGLSVDLKSAAKISFNSGIDIDMCSFAYQNYLKELIETGEISIKDLDNSVKKILELKLKLGLFDNPYKSNKDNEKKYIFTKEHLDISLDSAHKSIVLLKNKNNLLPLNKDLKTISIIGPLANSKEDLQDLWARTGNIEDYVTVLEGIKNKLNSNTNILYSKGSDIDGTDEKHFSHAINTAKKSDIIIAVLGESAKMCGEGQSRSCIDIPSIQKKLLKLLHSTGKPIILVLINGRPLSIKWSKKHIPAIVETWLLGTQTGNAIADILIGNVNPSGKLTVTIPHSSGQIPIYYNHTNTGRPGKYTNKKFDFNSKYMDTPIEPLFPFGFGLSYTKFEYSDMLIKSEKIKLNEKIDISIKVKNVGNYKGEEIVQLYIQDKIASMTRPIKELKRFSKISLSPGQEKTVDFSLNVSELGFYNDDLEYIVEPGEFSIFIGTNSVDNIEKKFVVIN